MELINLTPKLVENPSLGRTHSQPREPRENPLTSHSKVRTGCNQITYLCDGGKEQNPIKNGVAFNIYTGKRLFRFYPGIYKRLFHGLNKVVLKSVSTKIPGRAEMTGGECEIARTGPHPRLTPQDLVFIT